MNLQIREHGDETNRGSFSVICNGRIADRLTWDEMLALVASLTIPSPHAGQQWLKTPEQIEAEYSRQVDGITRMPMPETTREIIEELKARDQARTFETMPVKGAT